MRYNYNAPWHPLKWVCLGDTYPPEFYQGVRNSRIRSVLQRIAQETQEDYDGIATILKAHGVRVSRPIIKAGSILDFVDDHGRLDYPMTKTYALIPKPPMQPRDSQLIIGERLLATNDEIGQYADVIDPSTIDVCDQDHRFEAPSVTVIGDSLIVDRRDYPWLDGWIQARYSDRKIVSVDIGGHNDAVFAPVKPGVIISTYDSSFYQQTFPGWEVLQIQNQSWDAIPGWRQLKHRNRGRWWVPETESNDDFIGFIDTWLEHWLGLVEETVFDVNCLVLEPGLVMVNNYNQEVFRFLDKHDIQPVIAPFRHRFFWDGGIHCITSDLYREGSAENYI